MPFKLFDIGANLTHQSFKKDIHQVIEKSISNDINYICITGSSLLDSKEALKISKLFPENLITTCGIHPHYADSFDNSFKKEAEEICNDDTVKAIGETGLDFNRNYSKKENQINSFLEHIKLSNKLNLPMFLHQRDAHDIFINCLEEIKPLNKCVVHCFTGNENELKSYLEKDFYIGLTGWICDPIRGAHLDKLIPLIPINRLLIETDSPYLLPKNKKIKGNRNEPIFLNEVMKKIINLRNESREEIQNVIYKNSINFFNIQK